MKTAVLGAGLAGLSAAYELARHGLEVTVIEKCKGPGGLASTVRNDRFAFDLGPHRFHTRNEEILRFVSDLPGVELMELERVSRIRLLDRYFDYPLAMGNILSKMPLHRGAGMLLSFFGEKVRGAFSPREQETFEGWVLSRFGRALYQLYLEPYNRKLWGIDPSELSADWASQRITVPSLAGLVRETLFPSKETVRSLVSTFHYPSGGIGQISLALARETEKAGGRIIYEREPLGIKRDSEGWEIALADGSLRCDRIVNTIPLDVYAGLLGDLLPDRVRKAASALTFRGLVFLAVLLDRDVEPRDHWIYTSEDRYLFNRLSISRNFDPSGPSTVIFEFSCQEGDHLWNTPMDSLLQSTIPGAEHLGLFTGDMVRGALVRRKPRAYPVYRVGYGDLSKLVLDALEALPDSVTCGRQGLFRYNNMDHSIEMGRYAALEVLGEGSVRERFNWNTDTWADG